ncbi:conserved transmembrane transport domain protein [Mycobacterium ulcerans str. Harvey]|uniref:Conserved transmembrane transport domain protein n=1 Tax=Mycobacterium ulcerans str. Harvey TaxID=1299332 RepID=A0ABP3AUS7_MYCUL|nr:conserved transmembrane transport domain protein [Mycobacterium ulcerans str. Harvey]
MSPTGACTMSGVSISSFEKVTSRHSKRPGATPARTHLAGHARKGSPI